MKKLLMISAFALALATSCQNESSNDDFVNTPIGNVETTSKKPLKYVSQSEVYDKGVRLVEEKGGYAEIVANTILHPETSRRASVQCSFNDQENGTIVVLTQVSGDGQGSTYWISYVHSDGSISTYPNPGYSCSTFSGWYP
ncbi:hypothetical protein EG346_15835 [Chryseobacterium carnipullorum]|uniref:Uncharacterized protein n=1 Tax=Chryseobacterium carnipullorum TaxID=1124835 RepID=A0A3G6NHN6_CHRCU|nr:hypothetical protein [Chryseobacterium carnipullorum]AZA49556.1 hypothetical protein EG346_15835 [Chryseobacterium carnipullorum]AZA64453.1 hypothetical protein EG345_06850 [Chryseobacterium carnipullorum]